MDKPPKIPPAELERALSAVGDLLAEAGERVGIVVVGGMAMNLLGFVSRATHDVDVLAVTSPGDDRRAVLRRPTPLPPPLAQAVATVAGDLRLVPDWLNAAVASQWDTGVPPGLESRVHWRRYGGPDVGLADRLDLIFLKLYAAADDIGPASIHYQDLLALHPTFGEIEAAAEWVRTQDPSPGMAQSLRGVVNHARDELA